MKELEIHSTLQLGDEGIAVRALYIFLEDLGYLPGEPMRELYRGFHKVPAFPPLRRFTFDEKLEEAVAEYQRRRSLNVSGQVDEQTLNFLKKPRCAFPDIIRSDYVTVEAWEMRDVTYHFNPSIAELMNTTGNRLPLNEIHGAFRTAFATWQQAGLNKIRLTESASSGDIEIYGFTFGGSKFGGTYPPQNGDMYMDRDSGWSTDNPATGTLDLISGVLHEAGHALGLDHSSDGTAMDPELEVQEIKRSLLPDDIDGIRALYP